MQSISPDHYAVLGLDRHCTEEQIRAAYRVLARQYHPDVNPHAPDALARTQVLNAAYEILSDPVRRQAYDQEKSAPKKTSTPKRAGKSAPISQEVYLNLAEFLRGTTLEVRVNDPANPDGPETYDLTVPPETAPGTRFRLARAGTFSAGFVWVRVKARPDFRFRARGSDLRCELKISFQRAQQGGIESVRGVSGNFLRLTIPKNAARGEIIRLAGEGLPKPRGGRGDLLVKITYRPEVHIVRKTGR